MDVADPEPGERAGEMIGRAAAEPVPLEANEIHARMPGSSSRSPHGRAPWLAGLALGLGACGSLPPPIRPLDDRLRAMRVGTVVVTPSYSLYAPFDAELTRQSLVSGVERELDAVLGLFGLEPGRPIVIWFEPVGESQTAAAGESLPIPSAPEGPDGAIGYTLDATEDIVVRVNAPQYFTREDGSRGAITAFFDSRFRTLRHELAHVAYSRLDLSRRTWLEEGVAHLVELCEIEGDRLTVPEAALKSLNLGLTSPPPSIEQLQRWTYSFGDRSSDDPQLRRASVRFVEFLLARQGAVPFVEALRRIDAESDAELRALEPKWRVWIASE